MLVENSRRDLRSYNISHIVLALQKATMANAVSDQKWHNTLRTRASARSFWTKLNHNREAGPGGASGYADSNQEDNIDSGSQNAADTRVCAIQRYLSEQKRSSLAVACQLTSNGRGSEPVKQRVLRTLAWQESQLLRVRMLLDHLEE